MSEDENISVCLEKTLELEDEKLEYESEGDILHASQVMGSLWEIYKEKKLCDVTLIVERNEILAHKVVLSANSKYFYTMFTSGLAESISSQVVLKQVDFRSVELLVEYCYNSMINLDNINVENLLKTAHLLQFNTIVDKCCTYLQGQLHPANCLGIHSIAELHVCQNLASIALNFARKHFKQVAKAEEFFIAPLQQIMELLSSNTLNISTEMDVFEIALSWVKYDLENRQEFLPPILNTIRLPLLPPKVIVDCIESDELVSGNSLCLKMVKEAKNFHLIPERQTDIDEVKKKPRIHNGGSCLYVIGGEIHSYVFNTVDCYNFEHGNWTSLSCLNKPRDGLGVATYNRWIYAAGGCDGDSALRSVECYDPNTDMWHTVAPMTSQRHAFSLVELGGWLYSIGGSDFCNSEYSTVEMYDPVRDCWQDVTPMLAKREGLETVSLNGCLYAVGGDNGVSILNTMEKYDPRIGEWCTCVPMAYRRRYFGAAVYKNQIIVLGGSDSDEDHNSVECYDPKMNRWLPLPPLLVRRESPVAAVVQDHLFAIGGAFMNVETNSIDRYSLLDCKWETFTPMPRAMEGMGLAVL